MMASNNLKTYWMKPWHLIAIGFMGIAVLFVFPMLIIGTLFEKIEAGSIIGVFALIILMAKDSENDSEKEMLVADEETRSERRDDLLAISEATRP